MQKIFVVLEGGGAKGVAHVGVLRALEEMHYDIIGIAGTSAGALVAALRALGLSSLEMIDEEKKQHVLGKLDPPLTDATQLLGKRWRIISLARLLIALSRRFTPKRRRYLALAVAVAVIVYLVLRCIEVPAEQVLPILLTTGVYGLATIGGIAVVAFGLVWLALGGLARLDRFVECFNQLALARVGEHPYFHHFGPSHTDRPVLKVVATDVTEGTMELFSPDKTPHVRVADAVAASICTPIIFRSRKIPEGLSGRENHHFHDGGLVSNLPGWVFDDDRAVQGWPLTVVVEIDDDRTTEPAQSSFQWLAQTAHAAIFGARELSVRGVEPNVRVRLTVPDDVLALTDFDAGWDEIGEVIEEAKNATLTALDVESGRRDAIFLLSEECKQILSEPVDPEASSLEIGNVRVSMTALQRWQVDRIRSETQHNVTFGCEYWSAVESDLGPPQPMGLHGTIAERVIIDDNAPVFLGLWDDDAQEQGDDDAQQQVDYKIISTHRSGAQWNFCFPAIAIQEKEAIFDGGGFESEDRTHLLLVIDGDAVLPLATEELIGRLRTIRDSVEKTMNELVRLQEGQHDDSP